MLFSKVKHLKKPQAAILFLLILLTTIPLLSAEASVGLIDFRASDRIDFIMLEWETGEEISNLGFNLYRGLTSDVNDAQKINSSLIPSQGQAQGAEYEWPDYNVEIGVQYTYWIEDIDNDGHATMHVELPATGIASGSNPIPTIPSGGGNNSTSTPTPTRTPTVTPSPTTQSGSTATPSRTPTRTPTTQPTSSTSDNDPTATTAIQSQATAVSNNATATSPPKNAATATPEPVVEEASLGTNDEPPAAMSESTTNSGDEVTTSSVTLAQASTETESETNSAIGNAIGQNVTASESNTAQNESPTDNSNRSTVILMALIVSVILLIAGGGGIVALLLNRNKQPRA